MLVLAIANVGIALAELVVAAKDGDSVSPGKKALIVKDVSRQPRKTVEPPSNKYDPISGVAEGLSRQSVGSALKSASWKGSPALLSQ